MKEDLSYLKNRSNGSIFSKIKFKFKEIFKDKSKNDDLKEELTLENVKKEYEELKAKKEDLEKYDDELIKLDSELEDMDYCLIKSNDLNSVISCKQDMISRKFNKYENVSIENKAVNALMFFNKESTAKIENTIKSINNGQLEVEKTYQLHKFNIKDICNLYISYEENKHKIKNIEPLDKKLYSTINEITNKDEEHHLQNKEIKDEFIKALSEAKYELNIASPWMNNYVVNENIINMMEALLKRGGVLKIIYGIAENSSSINFKRDGNKKNKNSDNIAEKLRKRFEAYGDKFKIKKVNSHNKLLICDEKYYMETSFNLLSFSGEYDKNTEDVRDEGATYSTNIDVIKDLRNRYFNF